MKEWKYTIALCGLMFGLPVVAELIRIYFIK